MDKQHVIQAIIDDLIKDYEDFKRASIETRGGGADAESKSDGKYDTRSTEANYLADGQARQAEAAANAAAAFKEMLGAKPSEIAGVGALVEIAFSPDDTEWFFIGPAGGGVEVEVDGQTVTVITPESPMGRKLARLKKGEEIPGLPSELQSLL